jgi:hypothetical protein
MGAHEGEQASAQPGAAQLCEEARAGRQAQVPAAADVHISDAIAQEGIPHPALPGAADSGRLRDAIELRQERRLDVPAQEGAQHLRGDPPGLKVRAEHGDVPSSSPEDEEEERAVPVHAQEAGAACAQQAREFGVGCLDELCFHAEPIRGPFHPPLE